MYGSDARKARHVRSTLAALTMLIVSSGVVAQTAPADEQVRRLRLQMRQLQQEQTSLQEARAKAESERLSAQKALDDAQSELARQKSAAGSASGRAATLARDLAAARAEREALAAKVGELEEALKAQTAQHAMCRSELGTTRTSLGEANSGLTARNADLDSRLKTCVAYNQELHGLGQDLLARYQNKGLAEVLGEAEPFIQKARVRLENVTAEMKEKLDARHLPETP